MTKRLLLLLTTLGLFHCGQNPDAGLNTALRWQFDYRDISLGEAQPADLRDCSNAPERFGDGPAYPPIDRVSLRLIDPDGVFPDVQRSYGCEEGFGERMIRLRGLVERVYHLIVSAESADGTVLYRYEAPSFDLGSTREKLLTLVAQTGELGIFPAYAGHEATFQCPEGVETIRYRVFPVTERPGLAPVVDAEAILDGEAAACQADGLTAPLYIHSIPATTSRQSEGPARAAPVEVLLEGLGPNGEVLYCARSRRSVRVGSNRGRLDETLRPGECTL